MQTDEQVFDPALLDFKATFSIEQPISRNDFGTIKELLMKHCFPNTLTMEEKELRFNILLSHRHLYVLFKQNAVPLHEMAEQCYRTREIQRGETKIAKAIIIYENKTNTKLLKLMLIPKEQPTSFHIFKIALRAEVTNCGFKFYWSHNTLIQDKPFAEIARDCQTAIFSPLDEIDNCLFTEEKSMKYYDNQTLLKVGDMIKINKRFKNQNKVLFEGQTFEIIKTDKQGAIYVYSIYDERKNSIRIENSCFFHFSTLWRKTNHQFDNTLLDRKNVKTDNTNGVKMNLALENDNSISNIDIYKKRFQGTIISMGQNYGFIKCGYGEPNVFFHYKESGYKSTYIEDVFFISTVVTFRKQIVNGKPIAVALDVCKIGDGRENGHILKVLDKKTKESGHEFIASELTYMTSPKENEEKFVAPKIDEEENKFKNSPKILEPTLTNKDDSLIGYKEILTNNNADKF